MEDVLPSIRKKGYYVLENELAEERARTDLCRREIERLKNLEVVERIKAREPVALAQAKAETAASKALAKASDAAAMDAYLAASLMRNDAAQVENEELRKLKRHLQAELRQSNEMVEFLQGKLREAYAGS